MAAPTGWKKRTRRFSEEFFSFDVPGTWIKGRIIGTRPIRGQDRYVFHINEHDPRIRLPHDNSHIILPTHTQLADLLEDAPFDQTCSSSTRASSRSKAVPKR